MVSRKNSYSYIGISFVVLVFGIWAVPNILARFNKQKLETIASAPAFSMTDQHGKTITNQTYAKKVYVVEFFFTSCPGICITMNKNLQQLQSAFYGRSDFGIASFSIDPKHDTVKKLYEYADRHQAGPNWHFLTGDKEAIYALAEKGFNLYVEENSKLPNNFEHSGMFALIDQNGKIRCRKDRNGNPIIYYDGLTPSGMDMLKEDINTLLYN